MLVNYVRITKGLSDFGQLIPVDQLSKVVQDYNKDYYRSVYRYNEAQYKEFQKTHSVGGVFDVTTPSVVFDFDSKDNIEQARQDTAELVSRLIGLGVSRDQILVAFSGNKGYSVELETVHTFNPTQLKTLANNLANGLSTLDNKVYNASRIFRMPYTKHQVTGLYKLPITIEQLTELTSDQIRELAKDVNNAADPAVDGVILPDAILALLKETKEVEFKDLSDLGDIDYLSLIHI